jgi:hypothetical protein
MQPNEFARTREREKVRRRSRRKVDVRIGKGVPEGGLDIDRVMIYNNHVPFIFIGLLNLDFGVQFTQKKQTLS